jgi:flagellum-specific peptidoglycan hydrolase FlgJ
MKKLGLLLLLAFMIFSCGSKKTVTRKREVRKPNLERVVIQKGSNENPVINDSQEESNSSDNYIASTEDYLAHFSTIAQEEMRLYGIPASITLAQGILESNSGKGRLSVEANNHFGIKCHDWTGDKIYHDDDALQECFRKYVDAKYSFRDHSLFLTGRKRYEGLFQLDKDDYRAWAKGLKSAGYATDRKYPDKLISLIERYELYKLDEMVLGYGYEKSKRTTEIVNNTYTVAKGDTLYSISRKYNITVKELQDINGLKDTALSIGQELQVKP